MRESTAEWVRRIRHQLKLSQAEFGALFDVTRIAVYYWESGKRQPRRPALLMLERIEGELAKAISTTKSPEPPTRESPIGFHVLAGAAHEEAAAEAERQTAWMARQVRASAARDAEVQRSAIELAEQNREAAVRADVREAELFANLHSPSVVDAPGLCDRPIPARPAEPVEPPPPMGLDDKPERERAIDISDWGKTNGTGD